MPAFTMCKCKQLGINGKHSSKNELYTGRSQADSSTYLLPFSLRRMASLKCKLYGCGSSINLFRGYHPLCSLDASCPPASSGSRTSTYLCVLHVILPSSVADPDPNPDPPDPRVFWPPGSRSISQRYGSGYGSGSFYH
jgi:hypothetical protein